jgi:hypothetical protein
MDVEEKGFLVGAVIGAALGILYGFQYAGIGGAMAGLIVGAFVCGFAGFILAHRDVWDMFGFILMWLLILGAISGLFMLIAKFWNVGKP